MTKLFDKFEILECLKKDTHSSVYLARHVFLGNKIVLKLLEIDPDQETELLIRFKREARILARLNHPNIIKIIDFGISENQAYLSFEYFESENLRHLIKHSQLTESEKSALFRQLVQGLEAAHAGGVIHRDLKPENILIDKNQHLKIADFGLAFLQDDINVTNKSSIVGTPAYMSPEQIRGEPLNHSSDLFAVGIIGFELFCGYNPFAGKDINETINAILSSSEETLSKTLSALNDPIPTILKKLLNREAGLRGSAKEILSKMGAEQPVPEARMKQGRMRLSRLILTLFGIILIVVASLYYFSGNRETEKTPDRSAISEMVPDSTSELPMQKQVINKIVEPEKEVYGILLFEVWPAADFYLNQNLQSVSQNKGTIRLLPGKYNIRLIREEYPPYEDKVIIRQSELTSINVNLDSLFGYFICQVHPWGDITLDDRYIGQTPLLKKIKINPGRHILRVENPNFNKFQDTIYVKSGQTTEIRIDLETVSLQQVFN